MEKELTVTPDGRTIVDANQLFKNKEVVDFVAAIREIHRERPALRRAVAAKQGKGVRRFRSNVK